MDPFKSLVYLTIYFAQNTITSSTAQTYSYITNTTVENVYAEVGYKKANYVARCVAEGNAIHKALDYVYSFYKYMFDQAGSIEFIVASSGGKTCSYIYGEAQRLKNMQLQKDEKPSKIIVVYTLNYDSNYAHEEYLDFREALQELIKAGKLHTPEIPVEVKQFRPVAMGQLGQLKIYYDYQDYYGTKMKEGNRAIQHEAIDALHAAVGDTEVINTATFEALINDPKVQKIVDGILDSEVKSVHVHNQLLTAIPRAQIRVMSEAIRGHHRNNRFIRVICIDNPSGMDENGKWTIHDTLRYPFRIILSRLWHKFLVNSADLEGKPTTLALDITYDGKRLISVLGWIIWNNPAILSTCETTRELKKDVRDAIATTSGVFKFAPDELGATKMVVVV